MLRRLLVTALIAVGVLIPPAAADTLTTNLLLNKQTVGGNINSWGTNLNSNFETIDDKLGTVTTINTTGGTTTLTSTEELAQTIKVTGTLASNATIQFSGRGGVWIINNQTSGDFTVTAKLSGQTGVAIKQGDDAIVYSDAADIKSPISVPENVVAVGTVTDYAGISAPDGWLLAFGQCVSTTTYSSLYTAFGSTDVYDTAADCGAGLFKIPDLRGRVVVGQDDMGGTSANRVTDAEADSLNGDTLGDTGGVETQTLSEAEMPAHTHTGPSHTHTGPSHTHGAGSFSVNTALSQTVGTSISMQNENNNYASSGGNNPLDTVNLNLAAVTLNSGTVSGTSAADGTGATGASGTGASGSTGSSEAVAVMPPAIILNKIIYTGV